MRGRRRFVFRGQLPTGLEGVYYYALFRTSWLVASGVRRPRAMRPVVHHEVYELAEKISRQWAPIQVRVAEAALNDAFRQPCSLEGGAVSVTAKVSLRLGRRARRTAVDYSAAIREGTRLREAQHQELVHFRSNVFSDRALAATWMIQNRPDLLDRLKDEGLWEAFTAHSAPSLTRLSDVDEQVFWQQFESLAGDPATRERLLRLLQTMTAIVDRSES